MLVFVSDLHLTDGTSGETIKPGAFRIFRDRLENLASNASWRVGGEYQPIKQMDIVLLGDILDVIRSSKWLDGSTRPWDEPQSEPFAETVTAITNAILEKNAEALAYLKGLVRSNPLSLPATAPIANSQRPVKTQSTKQITTHIHYLIGNHDWFFGLLGERYDDLRGKIAEAIGLSKLHTRPFPHDTEGNDDIRRVCEAHDVFARHGDIFDAFNYEGRRDASSLGDAIVVELLNRFPSKVARTMPCQLPRECQEGLKEIDSVRPLLLVPAWIDGLLQRTCPDPQQAAQVKAVWNEMVDDFLKLEFVRKRDKWYKWNDLVDQLEWALKFSKAASLHGLSRLLTMYSQMSAGKEEPFYKNAFGERRFKNRTAKYIVYGHTHQAEIVPLDACYTDRGRRDQMYMNSGTWRRVHQLAKWNPDEEEFMSYYVMTYLAFFKDDERGGSRFEFWSGAMGE